MSAWEKRLIRKYISPHEEIGRRRPIPIVRRGLEVFLEGPKREIVLPEIVIGLAHYLGYPSIELQFRGRRPRGYDLAMLAEAEKAPTFDDVGLDALGIGHKLLIADAHGLGVLSRGVGSLADRFKIPSLAIEEEGVGLR